MNLDALTFQPVIPLPLLAASLLVGALVCLRGLWRARGPAGRLRWLLRVLVLLILGATCLRPTEPAELETVALSNADIFFVVDTTASMGATDGASGDDGATASRLDDVRRDLVTLVDQAAGAGARAALVTFDREARTVVPLTTDTGAVLRAAALLRPEVAASSTGTSVTVAVTHLHRLLLEVAEAQPDRSSVVVYLGDGEHTSSEERQSMAPLVPLVQGGLVLGYGTAAGATMPATELSQGAEQALVLDPATGEPAVSRADEAALSEIADELGLPYTQRRGGEPPRIPDPTVREVAAAGLDAVPAGSTEWTWVGALALGALLLVELAATVVEIVRAGVPRRRR